MIEIDYKVITQRQGGQNIFLDIFLPFKICVTMAYMKLQCLRSYNFLTNIPLMPHICVGRLGRH